MKLWQTQTESRKEKLQTEAIFQIPDFNTKFQDKITIFFWLFQNREKALKKNLILW